MRFFVVLFCLLFVSFNFSAQSLTDGLLIHYTLDNGQAIDNSGNGFDGVISGPISTEDRFGDSDKALAFDVPHVVDIPAQPEFQVDFPFSVSVWAEFHEDDFTKSSVFRNDFTPDDYTGFWLLRTNSPLSSISIGYGGGLGNTGTGNRRTCRSTKIVPLNQWTHIVAIYRGPSDMDIYLNGCQTQVGYFGTGPEQIVYRANNSRLGQNDSNTGMGSEENFFNGELDEFYFWNREVTEDEIQLLYDRFHVPESNLEDLSSCDEDVEITVDPTLNEVVWNDGVMGNDRNLDMPGIYSFTSSYECYEVTDTFELSLSNISVDLGDDINICEETQLLTANGDFDMIVWSTGEMTSTIEVNTSGFYSVTVTNECGEAVDEIEVTLTEEGEIDIDALYQYCESSFVDISLAGQGFDSVRWSTGSTLFDIRISNVGTYNVEAYKNNCPVLMSSFVVDELPIEEREETLIICDDSPIIVNGVTYDTEGRFEQVLTSINGCDSLLIFNVVKEGCASCDPDGRNFLNASVIISKVSLETYDIQLNIIGEFLEFNGINKADLEKVIINFSLDMYTLEKGQNLLHLSKRINEMNVDDLSSVSSTNKRLLELSKIENEVKQVIVSSKSIPVNGQFKIQF